MEKSIERIAESEVFNGLRSFIEKRIAHHGTYTWSTEYADTCKTALVVLYNAGYSNKTLIAMDKEGYFGDFFAVGEILAEMQPKYKALVGKTFTDMEDNEKVEYTVNTVYFDENEGIYGEFIAVCTVKVYKAENVSHIYKNLRYSAETFVNY